MIVKWYVRKLLSDYFHGHICIEMFNASLIKQRINYAEVWSRHFNFFFMLYSAEDAISNAHT